MTAKAFRRTARPILDINLKLFGAALFGFIAWAIWPSSIEWWGLGLLSIVIAMASFVAAIEAIKAMVRLHGRERAIAEFEAIGAGPKAARLATDETLKEVGMLDD